MNRAKICVIILGVITLFVISLFQLFIALDFDFTRGWTEEARNLGVALWIIITLVGWIWFYEIHSYGFLPPFTIVALCAWMGVDKPHFLSFTLWGNVALPIFAFIMLVMRIRKFEVHTKIVSFFLLLLPSVEDYENRADP